MRRADAPRPPRRRGRGEAAAPCQRDRQIAEAREQLLQPQRRAAGHVPGERLPREPHVHECRRGRSRGRPAGRKACSSRPAPSGRASRARAAAAGSRARRRPAGRTSASAGRAARGGCLRAGSETTLVRDAGDEPRDEGGLRERLPGPHRRRHRRRSRQSPLPEARTPERHDAPAGRRVRAAWPPPIATRLTGSAKLTVTALPRLGRSRVERMCADRRHDGHRPRLLVRRRASRSSSAGGSRR